MSSTITDTLSFIERVGPIQGFVVLSLLSAIFIFTRYFMKRVDSNFFEMKNMNESLKKKIEELEKKNEDIKTSIEDATRKRMDKKTSFMRNHPFFSTIDYLIDVKIPGIHFKSGFKKTVFTDILTFKLRASQEVFRTFVANESNLSVDSIEFRNHVTKAIKDSYNRFTTDCERAAVPPIVIESFNSWVNPLTRFLFSTVENVCDSKMYELNVDKLNAILSINLAVFDEMISNIELYLDEINGDFNELVYRGIKCEEEHH
jgi:hypothetical protein